MEARKLRPSLPSEQLWEFFMPKELTTAQKARLTRNRRAAARKAGETKKRMNAVAEWCECRE